MISLDRRIINAVNSQHLRPQTLVRLNYDSTNRGIRRATDSAHDIIFDIGHGDETFSAALNLKAINFQESNGLIIRNNISLIFTDPEYFLRGIVEVQPAGVDVDVAIIFKDTSTGEIIDGLFSAFRGITSKARFSFNEQNEHLVVLDCTGQFRKLFQIKPRLTTKSNQNNYHPNDTCFDYAYNTQSEQNNKWGDRNKAFAAAKAAAEAARRKRRREERRDS